ncbi:ComEC/Rec2 family competence protein [candidate division WOR-3 bacterium]|nr:ComEC/Rec2 family competence protein [candidate division WOR-3 bacterium]
MELLTGKRFLALRCAVVIGAGLVLGLLVDATWLWWAALILAGSSILPAVFISPRFLYVALFSLAVSYGQLSLPAPFPDDNYGKTIEIEATVTGSQGSYTELMITSPEGIKGRKALCYLEKDEDLGTRLSIKGELQKLNYPRNPGVPGRNKRLEREGVIGRILHDKVIKLDTPRGLRKWLNDVRASVITRCKDLFGKQATLYAAILLGERADLSDEMFANLKRTGTLHILAVSGLHVGVLVAFLFLLLRFFHVPRWLILPLLAVILIFYTALVGPRPSIIRASVMSLFIAGGFLFERKVLPLNSLAIAALVLMIAQPSEILTAGFQLSFAAAFGIILGAGFVQELFSSSQSKKKLRKKSRFKIPKPVFKWIILPLVLSFFATLFTMPFLAFHFNEATLGPLLANLPILPLVSLTLPLGLTILLVSIIWFQGAQFLGYVVSGFLWTIEKLLQFLPGTLWKTGPWPIASVVGIFLGALLIHSEKSRSNRFKLALGVLLISANLGVWPWALESKKPVITFLDTRNGNVTLLESDGYNILINPGSKAEHTVADYLHSQNIRKIDYLLCLSEKDGDTSGLDMIKDDFNVKYIAKDSNLPIAARIALPSCTLAYDIGHEPFYTVWTDVYRIRFTSEKHHIDTTADINYILNEIVQPIDLTNVTFSKEFLYSDVGVVIRECGGLRLKL